MRWRVDIYGKNRPSSFGDTKQKFKFGDQKCSLNICIFKPIIMDQFILIIVYFYFSNLIRVREATAICSHQVPLVLFWQAIFSWSWHSWVDGQLRCQKDKPMTKLSCGDYLRWVINGATVRTNISSYFRVLIMRATPEWLFFKVVDVIAMLLNRIKGLI